MPTQPYHLKSGKQVPGTTTIIGRRKEADGLIRWAWKLGMQGIDYEEKRDGAADVGTVAHEMCEMYVRQQPFDIHKYDEHLVTDALQAFEAFLQWQRMSQLMVIAVEVPLVSEKHQFGGTIDQILSDGNKFYLGDIKTSNRLNYDHLIQVCGAYHLLWEENFPMMPISGHHILRLGKNYPDFSHHYFGRMESAEKMFLHMRAQYDLIDELKARAA